MDTAVGVTLSPGIEAEILRITTRTTVNGGYYPHVLPLMAAIFDLPLTPMSESVHTSTTELLNPENVNVTFEISWIFCIVAEI